MLFKLCKTLAMACVALIIAQSSALSFTTEVAGKIDNVTDPVNKSYLFTDKQLLAMPVRSITTSTSRRHRENSKGFRWPISGARRRQGRDADLLRAERLLHRRAAVRRQKVQHDPAYKMDGEMLKLRNFGPLFWFTRATPPGLN